MTRMSKSTSLYARSFFVRSGRTDYIAAQDETIATNLEARTLELILDLLSIPREVFNGRSLTTGATASNILALGKAAVLLPSSHTLTYGSCFYTPVTFGLVLPKAVY